MNRFSGKLPKDDLKKFAKEVGKTLVSSDFKHNKVTDLKEIPDKKARAIKDYVKEYFKKAVAKKAAMDVKKAQRAERKAKENKDGTTDLDSSDTHQQSSNSKMHSSKSDELDMEMSDDDGNSGLILSINGTPLTPTMDTPDEEGLKRKRPDDDLDVETSIDTPLKRFKESPIEAPSPPPPPPPPPGMDVQMLTSEEEAIAAQEEELMRETEAALVRENEEAAVMEEDERIRNEEPRELIDDNLDHPMNGGNGYSNGFDTYSPPIQPNGLIDTGSGTDRIMKLEADLDSPQTPASNGTDEQLDNNLHPDRWKQLMGL